MLDGAEGVVGGVLAFRALEGERKGGEHDRDDASSRKVADDLARGAAAGAAAEGRDDHCGSDTFQLRVQHVGLVEKRRARLGGETAGAASGQTVAADEDERRFGGGARGGIGIHGEGAD